MIRKFFFSLFFLLTGNIVAFADGVTLGKGKVTVDFSDAAIAHEDPYVVKRGAFLIRVTEALAMSSMVK